MTFRDIFKSGFLDNVTSVSILDMALALVLAFGVGLFIFLIYKKTFSFSGMSGRSSGQSKTRNLLTFGVCLAIMLASLLLVRLCKRRK